MPKMGNRGTVKELVSNLTVQTKLAMLGASNPVMIRGLLPEHKNQIVRTLDSIIKKRRRRAITQLSHELKASMSRSSH
jgi:hypothetical protein